MKNSDSNGLKCTGCGEPVQSHWKICPVCEARLVTTTCPGCCSPIKDNWKRCPECETLLICPGCGRHLSASGLTCPYCNYHFSKNRSLATEFVDPVTQMEFVLIDGGTFMMGDIHGEGIENELPLHEVTVSPFYMAKYPVTQAQWLTIMPKNPSAFKGNLRPVEQISWIDAQVFIRKLSDLSKREGHIYRLPTEAEWEYAARSKGREEIYAGGDQVEFLAWINKNSKGATHPVGEKKPNGCGLFDMSGNIWEWCQDIFDENAYTHHGRQNPVIISEGTNRVIRGGSWNQDAWSARCARRMAFQEDFYGPGLGFRLLKEMIP